MEAIAHSPSFAKKAGVPQSVGKDFAAADKGKTFKKGGEMKESKSMIKKEVAFMKAKGAPKSMIKHEQAESKGYKSGGRIKRYDEGGISEGPNRNIDDETRARAMAWAARGGKDEATEPAPNATRAAARPRAAVTRVTEVETTRPPESGRGFNRKAEDVPYRGRAMSYKGRQSPERQQQNAENVASAAKFAASMIPLGRIAGAIRGGVGMLDRAMTRREELKEATPKLGEMMERAGERMGEMGARESRPPGTEGLSLENVARMSPAQLRDRAMLAKTPVRYADRNPIAYEAMQRAITNGRGEGNPFTGMKNSNEMSREELMDRAQMIGGGYKRGGNVKETMGPMIMAEDVEGGMRGRQMRFGEHSEQRRGHTRGTNMGDSGPSVGIEGGDKMKAAHVKHIMTMAAGGLTASQIAKIMSSMHKGAAPAGRAPMAPPMMPRQPMARPGMAPGMSHGGRTKRMAVGGISAPPSPQTNMPQGSAPGIQAQAPQPSTLPVNTATSNQQSPYHPNPNPNRANLNPAGEMMRNDPTRTNRYPAMPVPQRNSMPVNLPLTPTGRGGGINPNPMMGGNLNLARALMSGQKMAPPQPQTLPPLPPQTQPDYQPFTLPTYDPQILPPPQQQTQTPIDPQTQPDYQHPGGWQTGYDSEGNMLWAAAAGGVTKKLPTAKQMGAMGMKKGGRVKETMDPRTMKEDVERGSNRHLKHGESAVQKKGHTKGKNLGDSGKTVGIERGPKHFAKGGHVKSIDGIARRGHTKVKYR